MDADRAEGNGEMKECVKNESMLPVKEIMENIKEETGYGGEGLVAMLPFLRANNDGTHRLVVPLLEKVAIRDREKMTHIIIRKILYSKVDTGEVVAGEDAAKFFLRYAQGDDLVKPLPMFRTGVDKTLAEEYRGRQFDLIEKVRREICERGECMQDTYMDYLKYALYYVSDEFAAMLLYLSRTFSTDTSMELECMGCHKKTVKDVRGYREGQLVFQECPYCQRMIHAAYHKSGRCITYNDRYMRQERSLFLEKPESAAAVQEGAVGEGIFDTDSAFSLCESLIADDSCPQNQGKAAAAAEISQPVPFPLDGSGEEEQENGAAAEQCSAVREVIREPLSAPSRSPKAADAGQWPDIICQEAKVTGLVSVKRLFTIIRSMSFLADGAAPAPIFALFGDKGCGILTSIRCLSGYQEKEILYTDLSLIREEYLHALYRCIVIGFHTEDRAPAWLPAALSRLKEHTTVFFVGARDARLPEELTVHVVYRISYKPYTIEDLNGLFTSRMSSYGLRVSLTREQQALLFKNKNALDIKQLCQQMYFKHRLALHDGRGSADVISEEEIARELKGVSGKGEQRTENG